MPGKYEAVHRHEVLRGPGDARPTGMEILQDEDRLSGDLSDKIVIITGCSSGLGVSTAQAMAATGATIYCTARALDRAREALGPLLDSPKVHLLEMDLASLASVKAFADEFRSRESKLNILINNAGVMFIPTNTKTADGFEMHIGTNHFAHFYLFALLKDLLLAGSTPEFQSRVVNLSSSGHRYCPEQFDDINLEKKYDIMVAYGSSKSANIHMANQIERLYGSQGIHGYSVMPGGIYTPLQKHIQAEMESVRASSTYSPWMRSLEQGCATTVWAATARELEGKGGVYCENCAVAVEAPEGLDEAGLGRLQYGYAKWAYNQEMEERLWKMSLEAVGLKDGF